MVTGGQQGRALIAAVVGSVLLGAMTVRGRPMFALVVPALTGIIVLTLLTRWMRDPDGSAADHHRVLHWTMAAFAAHLLFGLVVMSIPAAFTYLGGDANTYHIVATWLVDFGLGSLGPHGLEHGKEGFYYLLSGLYRVFGPHYAAGLAVNATLGAALVPITVDTTRRLFGPRAARYVPPIVVLLPSVFLFTSQLLKEAPILFLVASAANAATRLLDRMSLTGVVVATGAAALLLAFRGPVGLLTAAALILGLAFGRRQFLSGITTGLSAMAVTAGLVLVAGLGYTGFRSTVERSSLEDANEIRMGLAYQSNTAFGADVDTSTPSQALAYLPVALPTFMFGPFPWQVQGVRQLPALADVLVIWALVPSLWRGTRSAVRTIGRRLLVIALPAVAIAVPLSLSVGNFGIAVRERMQVLILLVPIIAYGLAVKRSRATARAEAERARAGAHPAPALAAARG